MITQTNLIFPNCTVCSLFIKLRNKNLLDKDFFEYERLRTGGFDEQQALKKLQFKAVPPSGLDNYNYLQGNWKKNGMTVLKDFLKWYNNRDVVPTLEAQEKTIRFCHNKGIDMSELGCTLPNLANISLHKSTNYKFYTFCESDKDLCEKSLEDMTGGLSIVFTRKDVNDDKFIRNSSNVCKAVVGIDASQLYPFSMCQEMPTGLYRRWEFEIDMEKFKARHIRTRSFENLINQVFYQETRPECKIEIFLLYLENRKKLTVLM